jgi:catechol 2,3-dioxygenase-like lactoylglutathione lyase family enzyme
MVIFPVYNSGAQAQTVASQQPKEKLMLAYAMLGTNDKPKALAFYDAVLAEVGYKRTMDFGRSQAYGDGKGVMLAVGTPLEGAASVGNGTMMAIMSQDIEAIKAAHAKAIELGGTDEGAPGQRGDGFYGAYFRDLDGNKLCICKFG